MEYKLSQYAIITDPINDDSINTNRIVYSTRSGVATIISDKVLGNIKKKEYSKIEDEMLFKLIKTELLVPEKCDELNMILDEFEIASSQNRTLGYTITPSANCQLGCNYCGQLHQKINIESSLEQKIIKHLSAKLAQNNYEHLDITWYGAEPLMGYKAINDLSKKLIKLCDKKGIGYSSSMITNGLSLKEGVFTNLVKNTRVTDYQITIDGIKETHDNSRMTKQGQPTFDIIFNNVIKAVNNPIYDQENCAITIRINVQRNNYKEVDVLLDLIYQKGIHDKVFMSFAPIHDWGNNDADTEIGLTPDEYAEIEIEWEIKMRQLGFRKNSLIPSRTYSTCMTTSSDGELIDAKGEISYCWEVPYTTGLEKDDALVIGNLNNEENVYKSNYEEAPLRKWYNDIRTGKHNSDNCKTCTFLPVCGGACPISWYKGKPACPSFKYNIEDRLILGFLDGKIDFQNDNNHKTI